MRRRIALYQTVQIPDAYGGQSRVDTLMATVWGAIYPVTAREFYGFGALHDDTTHRIVIRYRRDVRQGMIAESNGKRYYIEAILNREERERFLDLMCREDDIKTEHPAANVVPSAADQILNFNTLAASTA